MLLTITIGMFVVVALSSSRGTLSQVIAEPIGYFSPQSQTQVITQIYPLHNKSAKNIAIAHNTRDNTFLVVYDDNLNANYGVDADNKVYAQLLYPDGSPNGLPRPISDPSQPGVPIDSETPDVVYNATRNEYVVFINEMSREMPRPVAQDSEMYRRYCYDIVAVRVSANGVRAGSQLIVSNAIDCQWQPVAAYDPDNDRFLVNWHDFRNSPDYPDREPTDVPKEGKDIYARFVGYSASGELENSSDEFLLSFSGSNSDDPALGYQDWQGITYNPDRKVFAVLWSDERNTPNQSVARECPYLFWERSKKFQIYGQIIEPDGTMSGDNFALFRKTSGDGGGRHEKPNLAYNTVSKQYMTVFLHQDLPPYPPCQDNIPQGGTTYLQSFDVTGSVITVTALSGWTAAIADLGGHSASVLQPDPAPLLTSQRES